MTTDSRPGYDRANRPHNGRDVADHVPTVRPALIRPDQTTRPDQISSDRARSDEATRPGRPDPTGPDPTESSHKKPTGRKRPRRLGRLLPTLRRKPTESVDTKARRAQLADQGATVGIPRGYGWAFLAMTVTTVVSAGAAFWFVFGNVTDIAAAVGVPHAQQKVVSPAIDVVVLGLTVVVQYLVFANAPAEYITLTRRLLVGSAVLMMLLNAAPPVLAALTTDYTGPILKATESFTPAYDQMKAGQLWGRAGLDIAITGILVAWSHWGPKVVKGFAEIKRRSDRAALAIVQARAFATEADRAEADRLRSEATELLEQARLTAADLIDRARAEATEALEQVERDRVAAASAARSATHTTAEAEEIRARAGREAEATIAEASAAADRARRALEDERAEIAQERQQMAAQRAELERQAAEVRAQLERERDALADDRRALEDLAAEVERQASTPPPKPPASSAGGRPPAGGTTPRPPSQGPAKRRPKAESIELGVAAWKAKHGDEWASVDPKKADVMSVTGAYGELALSIRARIMAEADGLKAVNGSNGK